MSEEVKSTLISFIKTTLNFWGLLYTKRTIKKVMTRLKYIYEKYF